MAVASIPTSSAQAQCSTSQSASNKRPVPARVPCPNVPCLRAFLGKPSSRPHRLAVSSRRNSAATMQATLDDYVADVPVAGEQANWYALVANAEFMLHDVQNEAFAEQLRERVRLFGEKERRQDFFLVCEPAWLDAHFPQEAQRVGRPCVALVSTDKIWITFMKLRLDRVLKLELGQMTPEQALAAGADYPEFPPLDRAKWTAPYSPYKPGWWKAFDPSVFFGNSSGTNGNSSGTNGASQ